METESDYQIKGPQDILLDLPQERLTSITRGRGPRRGNLERLLRYWRPIMKKPGGFTRCRVILANHPELYPLERICAWLHHETTHNYFFHPMFEYPSKQSFGLKNLLDYFRNRYWTNL